MPKQPEPMTTDEFERLFDRLKEQYPSGLLIVGNRSSVTNTTPHIQMTWDCDDMVALGLAEYTRQNLLGNDYYSF